MNEADPQSGSFLGNLLREAGYLDQDAVNDALNLAAALNVPFARVLVMGELVPLDVLQKARDVESGFQRGFINEEELVLFIHGLANSRIAPPAVAGDPPPAQDPPAHSPEPSPRPLKTVFDFLARAEVPERTVTIVSHEFSPEDTSNLVDLIVMKHALTPDDAELALICFRQLESGCINEKDALFAFKYCSDKCNQNVLLVDAAEQLGFHAGIWTIYDVLVAR